MYSIFISHSGVIWLKWVRARRLHAGSANWPVMAQVPMGKGAMSLSAGMPRKGSGPSSKGKQPPSKGAVVIAADPCIHWRREIMA